MTLQYKLQAAFQTAAPKVHQNDLDGSQVKEQPMRTENM